MDIYQAIADFTPPKTATSQNILTFTKGDKFEIFDCHKQTDWWGARSLKDSSIGYVPSKYMQEQQEKALKHFADIKNMNTDDPLPLQVPLPDYTTDQETDESSMQFVKRFSNIMTSIHTIDDMYPEIPEPDYLNDDDKPSDLFPPPPPPLTCDDGQVGSNPASRGGEEGLIPPRKLSNPCLESKERQALHKELLFQYKLGKNVLQKPELNKVLEKRKESQRIREWDEQKTTNKRTSLEMKLEERAAKVQQEEMKSMKSIEEKVEEQNTPEFLKMHRRITVKSKSENI